MSLVYPTDAAFRSALVDHAVRKGVQTYDEDRYGRTMLAFNPQGKPYEVCPMCSRKASVRTEVAPSALFPEGDTTWACSYCGDSDCIKCPGGTHREGGLR